MGPMMFLRAKLTWKKKLDNYHYEDSHSITALD